MAFVHGRSSRLLLDDSALSGFLRGWETSNEVELADTTVEGDEGHKFIPGLINGSLSLDGVWDNSDSDGDQDETLSTARGASSASVITAGPEGFALGKRVISIEARESSYAIASPVADAVTFAASWQSEGQTDTGVSLHDLAAESSSTDGSSHDNSASSASGAVAALHVTANTRDGSTTIKVQDSSDDSVFADLITFTAVGATSTTQERATASGTVDRYTRVASTLAGTTGSITYAVAIARR